MEKEKIVVQSLTGEQITHVSKTVGITEQSVIDLINYINQNDFISLRLIDLTPDIVIGFSLCEQQNQGLL